VNSLCGPLLKDCVGYLDILSGPRSPTFTAATGSVVSGLRSPAYDIEEVAPWALSTGEVGRAPAEPEQERVVVVNRVADSRFSAT
jgi:hypothetical protein